MAITKITKINEVLFKLLKEITNIDIHYICPANFDDIKNYIAFRYEKGEDFTYVLTLETWTKNEDIEWLEDILEILLSDLDKKIMFDNSLSFRFYYENKGEIEILENSDVIGREINFKMKIC